MRTARFIQLIVGRRIDEDKMALADRFIEPGSRRELESILEYMERASVSTEAWDHLVSARLTTDDLLRQYYTRVYQTVGSYKGTAALLGVNWRTVRDRVDEDLLRGLG